MNRRDKLMLDVAGHFERMSGIAHEEWIAENSVTMNELEGLFAACGLLLEGYAKADAKGKARIMAAVAISYGEAS